MTESEIDTPTTVGATLAAAGLPLGSVWTRTPYEDIVVRLTLADDLGGPINVTIVPDYLGTPIAFGDFDGDGNIDVDDYATLLTNLNTNIGAVSQLESYLLGDINGDLVVDYFDIEPFAVAFDLANGAGSFVAATSAVPEPSNVLIVVGGIVGCLVARGRGRATALAAILIAGLVCIANTSQAQSKVHFDAIGGNGGNTVNQATASTTDWFVNGAFLRTDNLWGRRAGAGIGAGQVFEAWGPAGGDPALTELMVPDLITSIGGLNAGSTYNVWVDYMRFGGGTTDLDGNRGGIEAGLTFANDMLFFGPSTGEDLVIGGANLNGFVSGDQRGMSGYLGTAVATPTGQIDVFIGGNLLAGQERTFYDGVRLQEVLPKLTLVIDPQSGVATIVNNTDANIDMRYYEIASDEGSLDVNGWDPLDTDPQNVAVAGWQIALSSNANNLSEVNLESIVTLAPTDEILLGSAFTPGAMQDVSFFHAAPGGELIFGDVVYLPSGLVGDYNEDGFVDAADYTVWRDNLGGDEAALGTGRDPNNTGVVGAADYASWRANFGASLSPASLSGLTGQAVPEPHSVLLLLGGLLAVWKLRRC